MKELVTLDRCCKVAVNRYTVFKGLTTRWLGQNQEWTWSRVDVSLARATLELVLEKVDLSIASIEVKLRRIGKQMT